VYPKSLNTSLVPQIDLAVETDPESDFALLAGWWFFAIPLKKMISSVGIMTFPIYRKNMFQINNQLGSLYFNQLLSGRMKSKLLKTKWWTENPNYEPN
jgi:hypothetical protein